MNWFKNINLPVNHVDISIGFQTEFAYVPPTSVGSANQRSDMLPVTDVGVYSKLKQLCHHRTVQS